MTTRTITKTIPITTAAAAADPAMTGIKELCCLTSAPPSSGGTGRPPGVSVAEGLVDITEVAAAADITEVAAAADMTGLLGSCTVTAELTTAGESAVTSGRGFKEVDETISF